MKKMSLAIIGSSGYLGSHLTKDLQDRGKNIGYGENIGYGACHLTY